MFGGSVLICDDEEGMLRYLKKMIEAAGLRVETFGNGTSLLARIEGETPETRACCCRTCGSPMPTGCRSCIG